MADITFSYVATERRPNPGIVPGKGDAHNLRVLANATIELAASASGTTVKIGRIPSNARIVSNPGRVYNDDLATSGSPTLDVGLAAVDGNITDAPTALNNGIAASAATITTESLSDPAVNSGKPAWQLAGASSDPGGELDVYVSVKDAATTQTGSVGVVVYGYLD